jgi:hypothetical protein
MNMNSSRALTLACAASAALFLSACAAGKGGSSDKRPSWIDGDSAEWSHAQYITGVGSADDVNSAADRARGEVARVFSADVSVNTSVEQSEASSNSNGKNESSFETRVADKVRTATQKVLEGVDIAARWKDPATGRFYALAALPKDQALLAVTEKAHEIAEEAVPYKASLASATDPFERAKAAAKILAFAKAWKGLEADSRVLGGGALSGDFDAAASQADAAKALAALDVVVAVTGDGADAVQTAVVSGLNAAGLTAKGGAAGDKSDLTATATVSVTPQSAGDDRWRRSRSIARVTLQDGRSGKIFTSFEATAREDATDSDEARRRSLATLSKQTSARVTSAINDYFANQ